MQVSKNKVLGAIRVGFEFEFFSEKGRKEIARMLGKELRKKIRVGSMYHSETPVDENNFKVEPDFTGGIKMHELVTGHMEFYEASAVMHKVLGWIKENGWTDEKCALHINISFDKFKINLKDRLEAINRLKFVLGFDEEFIYKRFPKRKNSIYARSINSIFPINKFVFADEFDDIHTENYELPSDKYYGINFQKLVKGYIEVRYCGGRGYEKKSREIAEIMEYIGLFTYDTLQNNYNYNVSDLTKLRVIMREHKKVVSSFSDLGAFLMNYPNIGLMVDLRGDEQVLKTFYPKLREKIFDFIIRCGMRKGFVNYDADVATYQIKDAYIAKAFPLSGVEIFDSRIQGNIIDCDIYRCVISNSHIIDCRLKNSNEVRRSKIVNTPIDVTNDITECYIDARRHVINGHVIKGIIRSGEIGPYAEIDGSVEIVKAALDSKDGKDGGGNKDGGKAIGYKDKDMPKTGPGFSWENDLKPLK